ncbi:hypothetical protein [Actinokineospora fastidiosa]|uniref:DUF4367 domain-containing protein n=1 Tax=Actinokineospora fastidiosa TaxID=1816 RepID=A0A918LC35_9PSEU|nr:hypothetical protein [Actinokineospora fastidiosa]GGS30450.1 hypothetical protein GCM10010171_25000 [Actinokineospora fastidiosa]
MRHPNEGVLRRLLDEPAGVSDADRQHVGSCQQCLAGLVAMREDADLVEAALAMDTAPDTDAAWARLSTASPGRAATPRTGRGRSLLRRPVVAAVAAAVVLAGAGTAAANDWLQIFRTEQVAPVGFSTADVMALPDLSAYGEVEVTRDGDVHEVPDAAAAAAETGLDVPEVTSLPRGVAGEPTYQVGGKVNLTFTFSAERAAEAAGGAAPPPPPGLDGSQVQLVAGPGVAAVWAQPAGVPSLVVGRAVAPTAFSRGVPFETVRDYLLSLPGLPADVATQLRAFAADGSTLPLPVPADYVTTASAEVNGVPATVLATRDRAMAVVLWVDNGVVTAVAGALDSDEVLSVAESLR